MHTFNNGNHNSSNEVKITQPSIWLIILAAGLSKRMGESKILLQIDGEPLIRYIAKKALSVTGIAGVLLVLNDSMNRAKDEVSDLPLHVLVNRSAHLGMSTSLTLALEELPASATAAMIWLADLPELEPNVAERVIDEYNRSRSLIVQASYYGQPNHPVLFDQQLFPELKKVTGDQGGRTVIKRYQDQRVLVPVTSPPPRDLDTKEDYIYFMQKRRKSS